VLTSAITLASWALGALPFEGFLRTHGGPATRNLGFLGYDIYFNRATSAFYDPNFYGIYSALVVLVALGLWLTVDKQRWLLWLAAMNVLFLGASLSRTGAAALLGTLVLIALVPWRIPRPRRRLVAAIAAGACVCVFAASAVQSRAYRARLIAWWTSDPKAVSDHDAATAETRALFTTPPDSERLTGGASLADRFRRINHGWQVFRSAPWLGRGAAALLHPDFPPHASAHVVYLTLLARYGIVGTLVYAAFALTPLAALAGRRGPPADAILLTAATCLALVFWSYDVFLAFELVYLFVGVAWGLAALPIGSVVDRRLADSRA
jgi:O-antigen ligase